MAPRITTNLFANGHANAPALWLAFFEGDEPNDAGCQAYGSGTTEAEAIADLTENNDPPIHQIGSLT